MTINISNLKLETLKSLIMRFETMSELEIGIILQFVTHYISGNRTLKEILNTFERQKKYHEEKNMTYPEEDCYKIIKYLIENR